ncbi:MAG: alpha/beta fold hydrolase [Desulfobacterales bacterium]|nr:MAG: alpha/beta fold hydrolase [Desulfobacterales bacterium]
MAIDKSKFQHLYPFKSHYLDLNGHKYHYLDEGSGDPIVMLHGNPTWSFYFRELIKGLSTRFRTIAPDHMGCGLSDKPDPRIYAYRLQSRVADLEALLQFLELKAKLTLVLHDWGGIIGMACAAQHPERIRRLVVMNTAAFLPPDGKRIPLRLNLIRNIRPLAAMAVLGFNLFARGALHMASHKRLARDVKAGLIAPYSDWKNRMATLKFVQDIPLNPKDPSYAIVAAVDDKLQQFGHLPTLICWGAHDFVFDMDYLAEWQRRFPAAEVHCFADAAHYVMEDVPDKIVPLVADFLQRHPL